ncbi:hypothetical protein [Brachyspira pilosicoli]|uniref:hypothetical protein n=1 Tax=Brachyspira pilosicoli TaxID=52584 RepID=UPI00255CABBE|nr:hypothetical protein [Brachyspira pilosicoli]
MEVTIVDLEEFTKKKAVYAKLGDYQINVNDVPVQVALKVNEHHNNIRTGQSVDIGLLIDEVVIPVIKRTYPDTTRDDILNKFTYDQIMKVMNMIFDCFFSAGTEPKKEDKKENKKKD